MEDNNPFVKLKNATQNKEKKLTVGFSIRFLIFGVLVFLVRRQFVEAGFFLLVFAIASFPEIELNFGEFYGYGVQISMNIFLSIKGNKISGRSLIRNGWKFSDNDEKAIKLAKEKWALS